MRNAAKAKAKAIEVMLQPTHHVEGRSWDESITRHARRDKTYWGACAAYPGGAPRWCHWDSAESRCFQSVSWIDRPGNLCQPRYYAPVWGLIVVRSPMKVLLKVLLVLAFLAASMPAVAGKVRLGFTVHYTVKNATAFDAKIDRVVVIKVRENSPAMRAGLIPGDIVELLNGSVVSGQSGRKLGKEMDAIQAGDIVKMTVLRSGKKVAISIVAGET
jgi:hypothetical protein